ncbi:hypothetical protein Pelo_3486 [Pelomyxa schiedti]|nr:hypothetical protein Pelo_3486 [Pelomyxa schiedti]
MKKQLWGRHGHGGALLPVIKLLAKSQFIAIASALVVVPCAARHRHCHNATANSSTHALSLGKRNGVVVTPISYEAEGGGLSFVSLVGSIGEGRFLTTITGNHKVHVRVSVPSWKGDNTTHERSFTQVEKSDLLFVQCNSRWIVLARSGGIDAWRVRNGEAQQEQHAIIPFDVKRGSLASGGFSKRNSDMLTMHLHESGHSPCVLFIDIKRSCETGSLSIADDNAIVQRDSPTSDCSLKVFHPKQSSDDSQNQPISTLIGIIDANSGVLVATLSALTGH